MVCTHILVKYQIYGPMILIQIYSNFVLKIEKDTYFVIKKTSAEEYYCHVSDR